MQIQRLHDKAVIPTRGTAHSAGLDLSAAWEGEFKGPTLEPHGGRALIPTGLRIAIPYGFYGQIHPRSGLAVKHGIDILAGVLDADYRGEIGIVVINTSDKFFTVSNGMKIAQLLIKPCSMREVEEVTNLPETGSRGDAGFGSTGV